MTKWYVKDLSKLTGASVQALHHYDRIGLLKPSLRLSNGYRVYSETDLVRLQQIIALKFFGFELLQIKSLLNANTNALAHFSAQANLLEQQANNLRDASNALKVIVADVADDKSIPWQTIIKLIEVYRMAQQHEDSWANEIFTADELKEFSDFEDHYIENTTAEERARYTNEWANLVVEMNQNLATDPKSKAGIAIGKKCVQWVNGRYGKKYAHLRTKLFEKGLMKGKGLEQTGLTPAIVSWMDKAMDAYWRDRIYDICNKVGSESSDVLLKRWIDVLEDMCGDDQANQQSIYDAVLKDDHVSEKAKQWLKTVRK